jgi:hypothetical protein
MAANPLERFIPQEDEPAPDSDPLGPLANFAKDNTSPLNAFTPAGEKTARTQKREQEKETLSTMFPEEPLQGMAALMGTGMARGALTQVGGGTAQTVAQVGHELQNLKPVTEIFKQALGEGNIMGFQAAANPMGSGMAMLFRALNRPTVAESLADKVPGASWLDRHYANFSQMYGPGIEKAGFDAAQWFNEKAEQNFPEDPRIMSSWKHPVRRVMRLVSEAIPAWAAAFAVGKAVGTTKFGQKTLASLNTPAMLAKGKLGQILGPEMWKMTTAGAASAASFLPMISGQFYWELIDNGVDPQRAHDYTVWNNLVQSALEVGPMSEWLSAVKGKGVINRAVQMALQEGPFEEGTQQIAQNLFNMSAYKGYKNLLPDMMEGYFESVLVGTVMGGLMANSPGQLRDGAADYARRRMQEVKDKYPQIPAKDFSRLERILFRIQKLDVSILKKFSAAVPIMFANQTGHKAFETVEEVFDSTTEGKPQENPLRHEALDTKGREDIELASREIFNLMNIPTRTAEISKEVKVKPKFSIVEGKADNTWEWSTPEGKKGVVKFSDGIDQRATSPQTPEQIKAAANELARTQATIASTKTETTVKKKVVSTASWDLLPDAVRRHIKESVVAPWLAGMRGARLQNAAIDAINKTIKRRGMFPIVITSGKDQTDPNTASYFALPYMSAFSLKELATRLAGDKVNINEISFIWNKPRLVTGGWTRIAHATLLNELVDAQQALATPMLEAGVAPEVTKEDYYAAYRTLSAKLRVLRTQMKEASSSEQPAVAAKMEDLYNKAVTIEDSMRRNFGFVVPKKWRVSAFVKPGEARAPKAKPKKKGATPAPAKRPATGPGSFMSVYGQLTEAETKEEKRMYEFLSLDYPTALQLAPGVGMLEGKILGERLTDDMDPLPEQIARVVRTVQYNLIKKNITPEQAKAILERSLGPQGVKNLKDYPDAELKRFMAKLSRTTTEKTEANKRHQNTIAASQAELAKMFESVQLDDMLEQKLLGHVYEAELALTKAGVTIQPNDLLKYGNIPYRVAFVDKIENQIGFRTDEGMFTVEYSDILDLMTKGIMYKEKITDPKDPGFVNKPPVFKDMRISFDPGFGKSAVPQYGAKPEKAQKRTEEERQADEAVEDGGIISFSRADYEETDTGVDPVAWWENARKANIYGLNAEQAKSNKYSRIEQVAAELELVKTVNDKFGEFTEQYAIVDEELDNATALLRMSPERFKKQLGSWQVRGKLNERTPLKESVGDWKEKQLADLAMRAKDIEKHIENTKRSADKKLKNGDFVGANGALDFIKKKLLPELTKLKDEMAKTKKLSKEMTEGKIVSDRRKLIKATADQLTAHRLTIDADFGAYVTQPDVAKLMVVIGVNVNALADAKVFKDALVRLANRAESLRRQVNNLVTGRPQKAVMGEEAYGYAESEEVETEQEKEGEEGEEAKNISDADYLGYIDVTVGAYGTTHREDLIKEIEDDAGRELTDAEKGRFNWLFGKELVTAWNQEFIDRTAQDKKQREYAEARLAYGKDLMKKFSSYAERVEKTATPKKISGPGIGKGINISSYEKGLGRQLTNFAPLAIEFRGKQYPSAEAAYQASKTDLDDESVKALMVEVITAKLQQHPQLVAQIRALGGLVFLNKSTHDLIKDGKTVKQDRWTGADGLFMQSLREAYGVVAAATKPASLTQENVVAIEEFVSDRAKYSEEEKKMEKVDQEWYVVRGDGIHQALTSKLLATTEAHVPFLRVNEPTVVYHGNGDPYTLRPGENYTVDMKQKQGFVLITTAQGDSIEVPINDWFQAMMTGNFELYSKLGPGAASPEDIAKTAAETAKDPVAQEGEQNREIHNTNPTPHSFKSRPAEADIVLKGLKFMNYLGLADAINKFFGFKSKTGANQALRQSMSPTKEGAAELFRKRATMVPTNPVYDEIINNLVGVKRLQDAVRTMSVAGQTQRDAIMVDLVKDKFSDQMIETYLAMPSKQSKVWREQLDTLEKMADGPLKTARRALIMPQIETEARNYVLELLRAVMWSSHAEWVATPHGETVMATHSNRGLRGNYELNSYDGKRPLNFDQQSNVNFFKGKI